MGCSCNKIVVHERDYHVVDSLHHDAPEVEPKSVQDDEVVTKDFFISCRHFSTGWCFCPK